MARVSLSRPALSWLAPSLINMKSAKSLQADIRANSKDEEWWTTAARPVQRQISAQLTTRTWSSAIKFSWARQAPSSSTKRRLISTTSRLKKATVPPRRIQSHKSSAPPLQASMTLRYHCATNLKVLNQGLVASNKKLRNRRHLPQT